MHFQSPVISFEEFRKYVQFWKDQQDKNFYFETGQIHTGSMDGEYDKNSNQWAASLYPSTNRINTFLHNRIVGQVYEVNFYPPSLLLNNAHEFVVRISHFDNPSREVVTKVDRDKYGLVFSQITYYEPIVDVDTFLREDPRISDS